MGKNKRRFKLNYTAPDKPKEIRNAEVKGDGGNMRVTSGKAPPEYNRPQPLATITIIDHGHTASGGGFLKKRFGR